MKLSVLNVYRIEPDALRLAFRRAHITAAEAARRIGYSNTYFHACYTRGWITKIAARALEAEFGITPKEYIIGGDEVPDTEPGELYDIVRSACLSAIKEVLK